MKKSKNTFLFESPSFHEIAIGLNIILLPIFLTVFLVSEAGFYYALLIPLLNIFLLKKHSKSQTSISCFIGTMLLLLENIVTALWVVLIFGFAFSYSSGRTSYMSLGLEVLFSLSGAVSIMTLLTTVITIIAFIHRPATSTGSTN